ncbi:MAG: transcription antitermination factor NusB [Nitrospinae bacterium]|nr:transcription antitermination factor NusB [Nitrospinota bacterium]
MGSRRKSREAIVTLLYQLDLLKADDPEQGLADLFAEKGFDPEDKAWIRWTVEGVAGKKEELDRRLDDVMNNWTADRLGYLERAILRLGAYELLHDPSIPGKVVIDEAVELAKAFCDDGSVGFVNGALDRLLRERPAVDDPASPWVPDES